MLIDYEFHPSEVNSRTHPWGKTDYAPEHAADAGAYYNFIEQPDAIEHVLEDFRPHAHRSAVQRFYEFLRWINGPTSELETNDCAFRGPRPNQDGVFRFAFCARGKVEFFFRDHARNVAVDHFHWMRRMVSLYLQAYQPTFFPASSKS